MFINNVQGFRNSTVESGGRPVPQIAEILTIFSKNTEIPEVFFQNTDTEALFIVIFVNIFGLVYVSLQMPLFMALKFKITKFI